MSILLFRRPIRHKRSSRSAARRSASGGTCRSGLNGSRRIEGKDALKQSRADDATAKPVKYGPNVVTVPAGDLPEQILRSSRRKHDQHTKRDCMQIAPGMGN